jgi:hypothetical protein
VVKRRSVFGHDNLNKEDGNGMRIDDEMVTCFSSSQTCPYVLQTTAYPDFTQRNSNLFETRQTVAQTFKPHHTQFKFLRKTCVTQNV